MRNDVIEGLYAAHYEPLLRTAYLLAGRDAAEDLVQDAFVRALDKWRPEADRDAFRAWAHTTMVRLNISRWRRHGREQIAFASHGAPLDREEPQPVPELERALAALTPRQRTAIVLRYFDDLSERQIAERMQVKAGTVKALLNQGRERLKLEEQLTPLA